MLNYYGLTYGITYGRTKWFYLTAFGRVDTPGVPLQQPNSTCKNISLITFKE